MVQVLTMLLLLSTAQGGFNFQIKFLWTAIPSDINTHATGLSAACLEILYNGLMQQARNTSKQ